MGDILIAIGIFIVALGCFIGLCSIRNIIKGFALLLFTGWHDWQKERLIICNECAPDRDICPECLCFKEPKVKVKSESCPLNKWQ